MAYYIDLFSPETYKAFSLSDRNISGFRERQRGIASRIKSGDKLVCYVTKLSRWIGILEVVSDYFIDDSVIFTEIDDPFVVRFRVKVCSWLELNNAIPVTHELSWRHLSFTKTLVLGSTAWTGMVRGSLRKVDDKDGRYLEQLLTSQSQSSQPLQFETVVAEPSTAIVKTQTSKEVTVAIPENEESTATSSTQRDSIKIQALLAQMGERMSLKIWLPRNDRQRVLEVWKPKVACLLESLPLNYDNATLRTIENIDVLWVRGRSIVRAFEVEHTTSIYSGILRMADLMALQPNLNIAAHIVAPTERRDKVLQEISRPVFAFLEKGPLAESCTFISYESIIELAKEKRLEYMTDAVLEEYTEYAEDSGL
jgi:hypothetical protein